MHHVVLVSPVGDAVVEIDAKHDAMLLARCPVTHAAANPPVLVSPLMIADPVGCPESLSWFDQFPVSREELFIKSLQSPE